MRKKGTLYFFTGLAGSGKTTIGGLFFQFLKGEKENVIFWDGDQRRAESNYIDYSTAGRLLGAKNIFRRMWNMTEKGYDVVCCCIAMYDEVRLWNRENFENYVEIYIKVSMETLYCRDQKGLYSSGEKNVVGVDLPWDEPKNPDIVIENEGQESPQTIVNRIIKTLGL